MSALNNYKEVKQKLDEVRMITGDLEFNTAVTFLMQIGVIREMLSPYAINTILSRKRM